MGLLVWIVMQTREVSLQTSLVLAGAAEAAADQKLFDQSLRLGVLAARASRLRPVHATAPLVLSRAADAITLRALFIGHTGAVVSASFSADGKRVVTASVDKTARVWDADTGKPVGESMAHGFRINSATFSPDGKRVVTASGDKTARVWDAFWSSLSRSENLIDEVCQRKLRGNVRKLTEADVRAARILSYDRVGENVCAGVATVLAR